MRRAQIGQGMEEERIEGAVVHVGGREVSAKRTRREPPGVVMADEEVGKCEYWRRVGEEGGAIMAREKMACKSNLEQRDRQMRSMGWRCRTTRVRISVGRWRRCDSVLLR